MAASTDCGGLGEGRDSRGHLAKGQQGAEERLEPAPGSVVGRAQQTHQPQRLA